MYFIQQKVSKGIDPPQVLSPDMVPPSERGTPIPVSTAGHPIMFVWFPAACHQVAAVARVSRPVPCFPCLLSPGAQGWVWGGVWASGIVFQTGCWPFGYCELEIL